VPADPAVILKTLGGRAERATLLRHTTAHRLECAGRSGDVVRVARGLYALPTLPAPHLEAARARGVLSHESAAQALGLETVFPPRAVHVTCRRGAKPPPRRLVVVHRAELDEHEVSGPVTSTVRTVLDCASTLPFVEALAVADSALRADPDLASSLRAAAVASRGPGRARRLLVTRWMSPLAANPFESALRGLVLGAGWQGFVPQLEIRTPTGSVRVDLADQARRVCLEADSFTWHGSRAALARDCRRYDELVRAGWVVLRFAWEQVMFEPEWVVAAVRDVCARN
jgi:very-short-patch-repair endonuclease